MFAGYQMSFAIQADIYAFAFLLIIGPQIFGKRLRVGAESSTSIVAEQVRQETKV
jgi:hypothetical protein